MKGGANKPQRLLLGAGNQPFLLRQEVSFCGEDGGRKDRGYCMNPLLKDMKQEEALLL